MLISYNWLKQYINLNLTPGEVSNILTNSGLEVENVEVFETVKGSLEGLVAGEVKTCNKIPETDHLTITTVDIGSEKILNIVCGAPNVAAGQKVIVAPVGTTLYKGTESFTLKKTKIRGQLSEGMICAEDEIGLGTKHEGIMVLDPAAKPGMPVKEYFKVESDTVFTIGLTPNRIDGASHFGAARDIAAVLSQSGEIKLTKPPVDQFKTDNRNYIVEVSIENTVDCPRYSGVSVTGVKIKPSPDWLQNRLKSIGLKPINNVVDVTNFILHETGQPLHAFDADKITEKKIIVKNVPEGTPFIALDNIERKLSAEDLMICNTQEPMAFAAVMGGLESGISEDTRNIFIESAYFNPVSVRKTAKRHAMNTDSSFRFERGTDPNGTIYALKRAALLVKDIAGGEISSDIVDVYPNEIQSVKVIAAYKNIDRLIGKQIDRNLIKNILKSLDIIIENETNDDLSLIIPTYRVDVTREADVIEEILRIYGYNNVEIPDKVNSTISYVAKPDQEKMINIISDYLTNCGFNEIMSNSLTKSAYYEQLESFKKENLVFLHNPLSSDLNCMRQTLLFSGLEAIAYNQNRKTHNLRMYEYGICYSYKNIEKPVNPLDNYHEEKHLALFLTGLRNEPNWISKPEPASFFELKTFAENIIRRLNINIESMKQEYFSNDIFSEAIECTSGKHKICCYGILSNKIRKMLDIESAVFYADFNWENLTAKAETRITFSELPKYPEVRRDLALLIDKTVTYKQIKEIAYKTEKKLLKRINLFDVYEGENIEPGKKSYAVSFTLQDETKTLTDEEIDKIMEKFIKAYEQETGAKIR